MDTVDYCHEMLESVVQTLRLLRDKYTEEYESAPKGSLICNYNHNRNRFYHARKEEGRYLRKYISPLSDSGRDVLKQLARKEYLRVELMGLEKNIGLLEDALRGYASLDATAAVRSMKRAYRMLDTSWFFFEDGNLEEFYWEFCGMMDNEEYVKRYYAKRGRYEKAGIVPWKNIIYSFARGNDIDMGYIESVIRTQIIPRL